MSITPQMDLDLGPPAILMVMTAVMMPAKYMMFLLKKVEVHHYSLKMNRMCTIQATTLFLPLVPIRKKVTHCSMVVHQFLLKTSMLCFWL